MTPADALDELRAALDGGGPRAALAALNARTEHRFTSLYRFDGEMLRALTFFDRADPSADAPDDIPVEVSYCVYVRDTERPFHVDDALSDLRVEAHPKCREVLAYYGVPVVDADGAVVGSLCHFDTRPVGITEENARLMEGFAGLLARAGLPRRGRPSP